MLSFLDLKGALACQITNRSRVLSFLDLRGALVLQIKKRSREALVFGSEGLEGKSR